MKDKKLSDYITNVLKEEGLEPKKKLTFDEWVKGYNLAYGTPPVWVVAKAAWEAAQENM